MSVIDIAPQHELAPEASKKARSSSVVAGAATATCRMRDLQQAANGDWHAFFDMYVYRSPETFTGLATAASLEEPNDQAYFAYVDGIKGNIVTVHAWWSHKPSKPNALFVLTVNSV
jgi:hypothetical protein